MSTLQFPVEARTTIPRRFRIHRTQDWHPLLWISGALAIATIVFTVVLIAAKLLSNDAVALEVPSAPSVAPDPFYQQKVDAKVEELPAQF